MDRMTTILDGLINRTEEDKLQWRTSADTNAYVALVDDISVVVRSLDSLLNDRYRIEIQNDKGITVEVLQTTDEFTIVSSDTYADTTQADKLGCLFRLARRSALDTDATLDRLANSLVNSS